METLLDVTEAAKALGIKKSTLYTWAQRRRIPSQKVGSRLMFRPEDLEEWLRAQRRPCFDAAGSGV